MSDASAPNPMDRRAITMDMVGEICEAAGFNADVTKELLVGYVVPSVVEACTEGEIVQQLVEPTSDPELAAHLGTNSYAEGSFAQRLPELANSNDPELRGNVERLIRFSAGVFAQQVLLGQVQLPEISPVVIDFARAKVTADDHSIELAGPPDAVVDYGPGVVQGGMHVIRQTNDLLSRQTYHYRTICKGPFVNSFLLDTALGGFGGDQIAFSSYIANGFYIGREDGVAAATNFVVQNGGAETTDLIIASRVHAIGAEELEVGLSNAYELLRPEGTLLIRAPLDATKEQPGSVPARDMVDMALSGGFDVRKAKFFDVEGSDGQTGRNMPGLSVALHK